MHKDTVTLGTVIHYKHTDIPRYTQSSVKHLTFQLDPDRDPSTFTMQVLYNVYMHLSLTVIFQAVLQIWGPKFFLNEPGEIESYLDN